MDDGLLKNQARVLTEPTGGLESLDSRAGAGLEPEKLRVLTRDDAINEMRELVKDMSVSMISVGRMLDILPEPEGDRGITERERIASMSNALEARAKFVREAQPIEVERACKQEDLDQYAIKFQEIANTLGVPIPLKINGIEFTVGDGEFSTIEETKQGLRERFFDTLESQSKIDGQEIRVQLPKEWMNAPNGISNAILLADKLQREVTVDYSLQGPLRDDPVEEKSFTVMPGMTLRDASQEYQKSQYS